MSSLLYRHGVLRHDVLTVLTVFTSILLLISPATAQLVGCDVLSCDGGASNPCTLGNATNAFIGTTNFTSQLISPKAPLTWTVGSSASTPPSSSNSGEDQTFTKNFYLGTPPSVNLGSESDVQGCALFFEGIARSLQLNGSAEFGSLTCPDALGQQCVDDLVAQASQQLKSTADSSDVCVSLQKALEQSPPASCSVATVTWGNVVAKGTPRTGLSPYMMAC
jgi:hypothetical protein